MSKLRQWLTPNQTDGTIFLVFLALLPGSIYSAIRMMSATNGGWEEIYSVLVALPVLFMLAAAACLGWWNFGKWRLVLLVTACVLSFLLPYWLNELFGWPLAGINGADYWTLWYGQNIKVEIEKSYLEWTSWSTAAILGAFIVGTAVVTTIRFVPLMFINMFGSLGKISNRNTEIPRTKILIFFAAFLGVMALINNALVASGINIFEGGVSSSPFILELAISAVGFLVAFSILVFWPTWALLRNEEFWIKMAGIGTLLLPAIAFQIYCQSIGGNSGPIPLWLVSSAILTLVVVFLAAVFCLKNVDNKFVYPSAWSMVPVFLGSAIFLSPRFYDYSQLMAPGLNGIDIKERVTAGFRSGQTIWKTKGRVSGANGSYVIRYGTGADPGILHEISLGTARPVQGWMTSGSLMIMDIRTDLDTSPLSNSSSGLVGVMGGTMSVSQLDDILSSATHIFINDVKLEPGELITSAASAGVVHLQMKKEGDIGEFLKSIKSCKGISAINIQSKITNDDWPEILRVSQSCPVNLNGGLPDPFTSYSDNPENLSAKNVTINFVSFQSGFGINSNNQTKPSHARFVFETDVNVNLQAVYGNNQLFWDLAFAKPERANFATFSFAIPEENEALLHQYHLVFGKDDAGDITDLFMPLGFNVVPVSKPEKVKTLSFDYEWLTNQPNMTLSGRLVQGLDNLNSYVNLEELYIPDCQLDINSLDPFLGLKKLRHLQIPAFDRASVVSGGFDNLANLESIRFMGKPDKKSLKELQRLPNLKRLEIVDILNDYSDKEKAKKLLERIYPNVEIAVYPPIDYKPEIPEKFKDHMANTKKLILEKLKLGETK